MSSVTTQYTDFENKAQAAVNTAAEAWTKAVKEAWDGALDGIAPIDLAASVDKSFDFAVTIVATQRDLVKSLLSASTEAVRAA